MTALSTLSVDDLVDTATARLSEAEDALREIAKRDPDGNTRIGAQAGAWERGVRHVRVCLSGGFKFHAAAKVKPSVAPPTGCGQPCRILGCEVILDRPGYCIAHEYRTPKDTP